MLINCTEFVDPATALQNYHRQISQRLARANNIDVSEWKCRLSFEWRNAVAWIERRDATGQPDSKTDIGDERNRGGRKPDPAVAQRRDRVLELTKQKLKRGLIAERLKVHPGIISDDLKALKAAGKLE
jgi:hypothetical protein